MGSEFNAHIFRRRNRGQREEVKLKLFNADGSPADLGEGGGGGGEAASFAWGRDTGGQGDWVAPVGIDAQAPFTYFGSDSDSLVPIVVEGKMEAIEIQAEGIYLVLARSARPNTVDLYYPDVLLNDDDWETFTFGNFGYNFNVTDTLMRTGVVIPRPTEGTLYSSRVRLLTSGVTDTPAPIQVRELVVIKL